MAVDEGSEVSISSLEERCRGNQFLLVLSAFIHRIGFAWHSVDGGVRQDVQVLRRTPANQLTRGVTQPSGAPVTFLGHGPSPLI